MDNKVFLNYLFFQFIRQFRRFSLYSCLSTDVTPSHSYASCSAATCSRVLFLPQLLQARFCSKMQQSLESSCKSRLLTSLPSKFPPFSQLHPSLRATPETVEPRQRGALRQQISRVAQTHPS